MDNVLLALAVVLLTASQVLQKLGAVRRLHGARGARGWLAGLFSSELLLAACLIVAGTAAWLAVLYRMDVSRAFPFLSLNFVAVVLLSRFYLREHVPPARWAGVVLIVIGVSMVAAT
jgi:undecaprenyl phosphate-alpha-L-ara4N flippase subunit ArnE